MKNNLDEIFSKLDLNEYLEHLNSLLSREKTLFISGDRNIHYENILELCKYDFDSPQKIQNLDDALARLGKQGILHITEIGEFSKILNYFLYLKGLKFENRLGEWIAKIDIFPTMLELAKSFDKKGELKDSIDERFLQIKESIGIKKKQIDAELRRLIYTKSLSPYLVDTQVHFINDSETLLVRGGFNHFLKGVVIARSSGGYFYVMPSSIENLKKEQSELISKKEEIVFEYAKQFSALMNKALPFLKFINNAFDIFDAYQARVLMAKTYDFDFVLPDNSNDIRLKDFAHPALKNPKSISVDFSKKVLLITGVNAGGKSMLLKSIITSCLLAKYLMPMRINPNESKIGSFKEFDAIIEDPQNVKNDISTFAGRMVNFSKLFSKKSLVIGVDEIELGTDFEEAASLYSVLIQKLISQDIKMVITTHHKRLAMLLSKNENVELVAALYDEVLQRPKFEFLKGTIGKSYAFETALRYGIPSNLVSESKKAYGEDKENLNEIITKTLNLQSELKTKLDETNKKEQKLDNLLANLKEQKEKDELKISQTISKLEREYMMAINKAKESIDLKDIKEKHRVINAAHEMKKYIQKPQNQKPKELKVGDNIKYNKIKGVIISITKSDAMIQSDGIKLRVPLSFLLKNENAQQPQTTKSQVKVKVQKPKTANVVLDLHGLRADEAIEKLDRFISDSLIMGFDEVSVYHGIGTGKLAFAVKEFLKSHPSVREFFDAPPNQGGFGAKIVRF
ncbi:endonuclease MutS2 [Campylobacter pinnipediorum subsp. pinnipediorum]|uniref:endonuclease MutS2 n=1 Tax=Campylobacter pinnipediorum TaxID=1965231 RepID=UPI000995AE27|nr:endonuclease MutS2 [Campylobacter pinnipediorum]OPA76036.1 endonuclease MutS2 [Campylobacter pinnipediorum subsp. pinnipediorum]